MSVESELGGAMEWRWKWNGEWEWEVGVGSGNGNGERRIGMEFSNFLIFKLSNFKF